MNTIHIKDLVIAKQLLDTVIQDGELKKLQLFFSADVLNLYRETGDFRIIRTDTSGRISKSGSWSLDFGISGENDSILHIPVEAYIYRLPDKEREHWLSHMISLPMSANFLKGLIRPGCLDDGDIRKW